jgi:hypothetical protein
MWLKRALRGIILGWVLLGGAFGGVAMRPEDIEKLLNVHNRVEVEQCIRNEEDDEEK